MSINFHILQNQGNYSSKFVYVLTTKKNSFHFDEFIHQNNIWNVDKKSQFYYILKLPK